MVDVIGQLRIKVAQRIIGQGGQMQHAVESVKIPLGQITEVLADFRNRVGWLPEISTGEKIGIQPNDVMTRCEQHGSGYAADVSFVTS